MLWSCSYQHSWCPNEPQAQDAAGPGRAGPREKGVKGKAWGSLSGLLVRGAGCRRVVVASRSGVRSGVRSRSTGQGRELQEEAEGENPDKGPSPNRQRPGRGAPLSKGGLCFSLEPGPLTPGFKRLYPWAPAALCRAGPVLALGTVGAGDVMGWAANGSLVRTLFRGPALRKVGAVKKVSLSLGLRPRLWEELSGGRGAWTANLTPVWVTR